MAEKKDAAQKTAARKTAGRSVKRAPKAKEIQIDYPRGGDVIPSGGHYAVRVGSKPHELVEITFDNKKWYPCREAVGYYWFDWYPTKAAKVTLVARARNGQRTAQRSAPIKIQVAS